MRIGIDCRLPYYRMGGISQYVLNLIPALAALDQENQYFLFHSRKDRRSYLPPGARNFRRRNLWTPCHHRYERWALTAELLRHRLDVFHSPDFIPPLRGAKRRVVTIHDLNFIYYPQFLTEESRRYYIDQIQWAVQSADAISADSYATRKDVLSLLSAPPEKVKTIHLAASPQYLEPVAAGAVEATLRKYDLSRGFILFVGTLEPRKNVSMLLRVYARLLAQARVDVPLVLVGGAGWLYEEIFETADELALDEQVRHLSGVEDRELQHLYHAAGVLVTPSHYEGFGLPALEAQHSGCPVIVSDRGSLPEIVGPEGLMLNADDEVLWANTIERVLTDEALRARLVENGYRQAARFSWDAAARATLALYKGEG